MGRMTANCLVISSCNHSPVNHTDGVKFSLESQRQVKGLNKLARHWHTMLLNSCPVGGCRSMTQCPIRGIVDSTLLLVIMVHLFIGYYTDYCYIIYS